jgi:predicted nucleotidyltransferase component of viral defense system
MSLVNKKTILDQMLEKYSVKTENDAKNAIKEVVQEIALYSLSKSSFFKNVAFYGGTALRIFHGLDRFSEDLAFSLLAPNSNFELQEFLPALKSQVNSFGLNFEVEQKDKKNKGNIQTAFLKGNTKEHIIIFYGEQNVFPNISKSELIKIKIEIDINPPDFASFEIKNRLLPALHQVKLYDMPSLFASKIHAILCRGWQNRVKGRDLYDYIFYLSKNTNINMPHLKARLVASNFIKEDFDLSYDALLQILNEHFASIDYEQAKKDVLPFLANQSKVNLWSGELFIDLTKDFLKL